PMDTKERRWPLVLAAALYAALALFYLRPIWQVWQDRIAPSTADPLFNLWVLKWGVHQVRTGMPDLWNGNVFHPTRGTLALSDHLIGPAFQISLFDNAIAGYNFLFFTSFVLTGLTVCWVVRRSGCSWTAAVLAGAMYAFSPFRLTHLNHIQILLVQWAPLTLWFWDRLLAERKVRHAVLFLVFYLLHVTGGAYLAYMIHIPLLVILVNRGRDLVGGLRVLIPVALVAGGILAAVFLPYATLGLERDSDEVGEYGATLLSWLSPARSSLWFGPISKAYEQKRLGPAAEPFFRSENALFAGFVPTILAGLGLWVVWKRRPDPWERGLLLSGLACFALAHTVIYVPMMHVLPGLSGMRVPARFAAFVSLAVVFLAARGMDQLLERRKKVLVGALALILFAELIPKPVRWARLEREEDFPEVYSWIAQAGEVKAILELPVRPNNTEAIYMYYSTRHWKPIANGFSGYLPESHRRITSRMRFLPDEQGLDLLSEMGITHLVVHARALKRKGMLPNWEREFVGRRVELVRTFGEDRVYRLLAGTMVP
ncbi:MAG TPA: hypothetical protein VFR31_18155, partial [Thermoanaerobaculia bacterium]|nr:hypothetical protein [Thermoanaerobaculia bacterium]